MTLASGITLDDTSGISFIEVDNDHATARISLYGGHVVSFIPKSDNTERLWLSPHAHMDGKKPIRGGVPVCWPWFSDDHGRDKGALPSHGFLRSQMWKIAQSEASPEGTRIVLCPAFTRADGFEHDSDVQLTVTVGRSLTISLTTTNTGVAPFTFNAALHSYFYVPDIHHTSITGIESDYTDKNDNWAVKPAPSPYLIEGEVDRIHSGSDKTVTVNIDASPFTAVHHANNDSVVVWTPWQGAASITDMDAFGFVHMICIETAVTKGHTLAAGASHSLTQTIEPLH
ncbi:D-hexose-6-phosphate mutarotase [Alteromonas halophila]|uniref:Putative glucose-6-phosphate 1-epimerase n=1 Tax=Alteromonas halophila TaxID=516698 RepID=A0A918JI71_9ALTE|nr:D-hexose-6-phosphate mutarotase [Alteromonas halophila]GGW76992.1 D-hexose-6-phosphate mutarotase [Alteromonas halophila]